MLKGNHCSFKIHFEGVTKKILGFYKTYSFKCVFFSLQKLINYGFFNQQYFWYFFKVFDSFTSVWFSDFLRFLDFAYCMQHTIYIFRWFTLHLPKILCIKSWARAETFWPKKASFATCLWKINDIISRKHSDSFYTFCTRQVIFTMINTVKYISYRTVYFIIYSIQRCQPYGTFCPFVSFSLQNPRFVFCTTFECSILKLVQTR